MKQGTVMADHENKIIALEKRIEELNEQLDAEHGFRREWRDQWCKDGQELSRLRELCRALDIKTVGVST